MNCTVFFLVPFFKVYNPSSVKKHYHVVSFKYKSNSSAASFHTLERLNFLKIVLFSEN